MISKYFSLKEAIYLPQWKRLATIEDGLTDEVKANLTSLFTKMDTIREHFNVPITVHVAFRPTEYNKLVGGAPNSSHLYGMAVDFHVKNKSCDDVRAEILKKDLLKSLNMRMENLPGSSWVHLDIKPVTDEARRYFKP